MLFYQRVMDIMGLIENRVPMDTPQKKKVKHQFPTNFPIQWPFGKYTLFSITPMYTRKVIGDTWRTDTP